MWLFSGLMSRVMEKEALSNALVRTTSAITIFHGGIKVIIIQLLNRKNVKIVK